jgi:hypothetical protein
MRIMGNDLQMPESPQAKFWTWVVGIVIATAGVMLFLDGHFMRAAAGAEMKAEYTAQIAATNAAVVSANAATQLQIEYSADTNAKRQIDNRLFELEQTPPDKLKPQDRALYQKLQRDRAELVDLWIRRGRPLR